MSSIILVGLSTLWAFQLPPAEPKPLSVCEILSHTERYSGKVVTVAARLRLRNDTGLAAEDCGTVIEVSGLRFDSYIAVDWPGQVIDGARVSFPKDESSVRRMNDAIRSIGRNQYVRVVVQGLVVTREPPRSLVAMYRGRLTPVGFGAASLAPAMIIIKDVKEAVVETTATKLGP